MLPPIVSWGEVLWDRFVDAGPEGAALGGAPANVAWHLAMLGAPVALVTRVGDDDDGRAATRRLAARGVDVSLVQVDPERATGEVQVTVEAGEARYALMPGRAWERIEATEAALAALARAPAMVFGTLAQRKDEGLATWRDAVAACGAATLKVCDPNLRPRTTDVRAVSAALEIADVVKVNEREVAQIEQWVGTRDLVDWLLVRRRPAAKVVAVTRGATGSTLHDASERVEVPAWRPAVPGDNIGCGDAYVAVLTFGLCRGWSLGAIGALASRWAGMVAGARGATPDLDADAITQLILDNEAA